MYRSTTCSLRSALVRLAIVLLAAPLLAGGGCATDDPAAGDVGFEPSTDARGGSDVRPGRGPDGVDAQREGDTAAPSGDAVPDDTPAGARVPSFPAPFLAQDVAWEPCPLFADEPGAECADVTVPQRWREPDEATLTVRVMRYRPQADAGTQLWLLHGGPAPGLPVMGALMRAIADRHPDIEFYTLDHRGTGASSWVGCPEQPALDAGSGRTIEGADWDACIRHVEEEWPPVDTFRTTEAALDVAFLAQLVDEDRARRRFVYGMSYGTTWAHRVAQVAPDLAEGFVLDSVALPTAIAVDRSDAVANRVAEDLLSLCVEQPACRARLGDDPVAYAHGVFAALDAGHCPDLADAGIDVPALKSLLLSMGMASEARALLPATLYRVDRCEPRDVAAVRAAWIYLRGDDVPPGPGGDSPVLREHVLLSELRGELPRPARMAEHDQENHIVTSGADWQSAWLLERWPTYETDEYHGAWAPADVPLLMMNGTLDFQTTRYHQEVVCANLAGPHQRCVEVPWGNHGLVSASPVRTEGAPSCGLQLLLGFLDDPLAEPDDACLDDLVPPDFDGPSYIAPSVLHEADLWDNPDPQLDCGVPDDLLEPESEEWLTFAFRGPITAAGVRYGVGAFDLRVGATTWDASLNGSYARVSPDPDGAQGIALTGISRYAPLGAASRRYILTRAVLPGRALDEWQQSDGAESDLADLTGATVTVLEVEERLVGSHLHARVCPRATSAGADAEASSSRLRLCSAPDETFGDGEDLQIAGRVALVATPPAAADCYCVVDSATRTDCAVFDDSAPKSATPQAALVPALPPAEALPPLPPPRRRLTSRL